MADGANGLPDNNPFTGVPIEISVRVGAATPTVGELLALGPQSVLTLDAQVDDPVSLYVGDKLIAKGQLEEKPGSASGQLIVRLTEVADLSGSLA